MNKETLSKAHALFLDTGNYLSPEMILLRSRFLSSRCIEAFRDDEIYLLFLKNLISERFNLSFPEESALYQQYFNDCITLKDLEQSLPEFSVENYLSDTIQMFDTLKTPYYNTYFRTMIAMKSVFKDKNLQRQTLKDFYGIMIKSSPKELPAIAAIAEQAVYYHNLPMEDEAVIQGLLLSNLASFSGKGESISQEDIQAFLDTEKAFFDSFASASDWNTLTLPDLLADHTIYMERHQDIKENSAVTMPSQAIDSEFLNHYAYNMNTRSYISNPAIGREPEISDLALILISPKKSPILIGEAGVGKTSVVEGLAYALQQGNVPALLKDKKIFKLTTTSLLSGTKYVGEMEERMKTLMDELSKHPDVILFIDEIHTIVGAGSTESSNNDISNMLKPYIDRGDIKLIGATTSEEYHRFIRYDQALSRRFYPIEVEEPDDTLCLRILTESIPAISHETAVSNPFDESRTRELLRILLKISLPENQPEDLKTHWPELPLSLLEMAFSYAALDSRSNLEVSDFIHAVAHSNRLKKSVKTEAADYFTAR